MICIKITRGHSSVKLWVKLRYLLSSHCLIMLYICTNFCVSISKGFRVKDSNIRVNAGVVTNVDGWTDERTENRIPISRHA